MNRVDGPDHDQRVTFDVLPDHPVELEATLTLRSKRRVHSIARRGEAL